MLDRENYRTALLLDELQLLECAVHDRLGVHAHPVLKQRGVRAAEVVVEVHIAFELVLGRERGEVAVQAALDAAAYDERNAS